MFRFISLTTAATFTLTPALADGINYAHFSYTYEDREAGIAVFDRQNDRLVGAVEYQFGQFLLSADAIRQSFENGFGVESSRTGVFLSVGYMITPDVLAGLGVMQVDPSAGDTTNGFEAFGQYDAPEVAVGVNITKPDTDDDNIATSLFVEYPATDSATLGVQITDQSEFEETTTRISVDYAQGPITGRAFITGSSYDDGGRYGLAGSYALTPQIRADFSYQASYGDDFQPVSIYRISGAYQITDGLWIDAAYGTLDAESDNLDADIWQIGLSYELGRQKRIDRRFQQAAINDAKAGFGSFEF